MKKNYSELLKDPRWQKKRLQVMERDNFTCASCQSSEATLNVHHCVPYKKGAMPWEYEIDELITLCETCHLDLSNLIMDCNTITMKNCKSIDTAVHYSRILWCLEGLNPFQMSIISEIVSRVIIY